MPHHHHYPQHPPQWCGYEVVRGLASSVQEKVDNISHNSSFLKTQPDFPPCFDLCELGLGPILGSGAFSQVQAVTHFQLRHEIPQSRGHLSGSSSYHRKLRLAEHTRISGHGRAPYAIKHLRPDLVGEDLESAAVDLCIEVKFLTRLNHPNIVKVRGLANEGTNAFDSRRDGFFIIMDRLEPLDHRIHRWRDRAYRFPDCRPVSLTRKMDYASQVADAMDYLHDRRIIFR
jgi:serine/threonine protein kinase